MKLILLLAWRHITFQGWRSTASILGIAVGIATVVSVLVIDHNTLLSQEARREPTDPSADLLIQPELRAAQAFDSVREDLLGEELLEGVTAFATGKLTINKQGKPRGAVELMAVEEGAESHHEAYFVEEGEGLDFASEEPQLLVSPGLAQSAGLAVGDLVNLTPPTRRRAPVINCVDGELVRETAAPRRATPTGEAAVFPFRVVGIMAPTRLGYGKQRAVTTFTTGQEVLGRQLNPRFWADFDLSRTDFNTVSRALSDRYVITAPRLSLSGLAPEEKAFRSGVRLCGFLALFLGLYIIFNTMSMSLVERVRSIGLLRSLGLTQGRLLGIFLVEGLILSGVGAALALALSAGIVRMMTIMRITTLGYGRPIEIREVPWIPVVACMAAGILFCLLGVLYPFLRASRLSVIDALRRGVIELSQDPFRGVRRSVLIGLLAVVPVAWMIGAPPDEYIPTALYESILLAFGIVGSAFAVLLIVPGLLSGLGRMLTAPFKGPAVALTRSTLAAARHRVFGTVSGLMLVFAAIFLIVSVLESLKSEMRSFGERALDGRVYIKTTAAGATGLTELRKSVPELRTLSPLNAETTSSFLVRGISERMLWVGSFAQDQELRQAFANERTIILSTRCADDLGKEAGDTVRMAVRSGGGIEDYRVLAVTDEYGFAPDERVFGIVSEQNMLNDWCIDSEGQGDYFVIWAPDMTGKELSELRQAVLGAIGEDNLLDFRRGEQITEAYVRELDRDFGIFYAILVLTILLAAVGILNAMVIAVMERRREIGLLRSVGLTGGQVATMLLSEAGVLGVLGGVFGLVLGVPLAVITADTLTTVSHLDLSFDWSPRALGSVLGGAVLISTLAVLLPALRANRLRLSDVIRYE